MEANKYRCRFWGKENLNFNCSCRKRHENKNLWNGDRHC